MRGSKKRSDLEAIYSMSDKACRVVMYIYRERETYKIRQLSLQYTPYTVLERVSQIV